VLKLSLNVDIGMQRIVVLGTGTGVGKTTVSAALLRALRRATPGSPVLGLKPVETGVREGAPTDARALEEAAGVSDLRAPHPLYAFPKPVSPHLASRLAGLGDVELPQVVAWVQAAEERVAQTNRTKGERAGGWSVVETAGALLSPLAPGVTNFDLARSLEPAIWILVGSDSLGTLHDVSATLEVLRQRGRLPDHVVLSAARVDESTGTNAGEMRLLGIVHPSAVLDPNGDGLEDFAARLSR
jgi:dethiobiotin synthetase